MGAVHISTNPTIMTFTLLLILLIRFSTVAAQPPAAPPPYTFNPSVATIIVIVISAVFFIVFFTLYLRLCSSNSSANPLLGAAASLRRRSPGLDATTVASFPVFHYHEVKELKMGKNALECAICLNEFEDDETLRLLPSCDHVFHPECIDAWFESHVTCPVCRANLLPGSSEKPLPESPPPPMSESISDDSMSVSAQILPDQSLGKHTGLFGKSVRLRETYEKSMGKRTVLFGKFPRSHSTGHSLVVVRPGEDTDRFTLRFPEQVRKEVLTRSLIRTATFNITTEGSSRRSQRGGEGSSRGARSYKRLDRAVKSDRWVITVPFFSGKAMGGEREGSIGRGKVTAVKLPSFKCLESGASGDAYSVGQARPAV